MKTIFMFPGQGSQKSGMGEKLFPLFKKETEFASQLLNYNVVKTCLDPNSEIINQTEYTQPLLFLVNYLSYLKFRQENEKPADLFIGHSLGEYNALAATGVFSFETGLRFVQKRGALMGQAGEENSGSMIAVIGLPHTDLQKILPPIHPSLEITNYNSPEQSIVSGKIDAIQKLADVAKKKGAKRCILLNVSGAFHSSAMKPTAQKFYDFLQKNTLAINPEKATQVYSNTTANPYPPKTTEIFSLLQKQLFSPVQWIQIIQNIKTRFANKNTEFIEIGPGKVLAGLVKRISA